MPYVTNLSLGNLYLSLFFDGRYSQEIIFRYVEIERISIAFILTEKRLLLINTEDPDMFKLFYDVKVILI